VHGHLLAHPQQRPEVGIPYAYPLQVLGTDGEDLVELADSPLAGNVRIFTDYDPEWEVDISGLMLLDKIGERQLRYLRAGKNSGSVVTVAHACERGGGIGNMCG
jgi:hypothetical protein